MKCKTSRFDLNEAKSKNFIFSKNYFSKKTSQEVIDMIVLQNKNNEFYVEDGLAD